MHFPKLTPLQSRFAASFIASCVIVILYYSLSNPHFAYAADPDSIIHEDHNHPRLLDLQDRLIIYDDLDWEQDDDAESYMPGFIGLDRGIVGRAASGDPKVLENNAPEKDSIVGGETHYWYFPNQTIWRRSPSDPSLSRDSAEHEAEIPQNGELAGVDGSISLGKRQNPPQQRLIYISLNTCDQAQPNTTNQNGAPPQLLLYISKSESNSKPGPSGNKQQQVPVDGGFGDISLNVSSDVWIGVAAPASSNFNGSYNYEITASTNVPYTSYNNPLNGRLFHLDSDNSSALFYTNITDSSNAPYTVFVHNQNDPAILGLHRSYCGLKNHAQIKGPSDLETGTSPDLEGGPTQQFYVKNLNSSSAYYAFMALDGSPTVSGNGIVGGGGQVWEDISFTTKSDGNCQLIYNLSFCTHTAYAVPSNFSTSPSVLASFYDDNAKAYWQNFSNSLEIIPCNTTPTAKYSLVRTCEHCRDSYKQWLCAVTIPRCADFSSPIENNWLQPRNINSNFLNHTSPTLDSSLDLSRVFHNSRNPLIDDVIRPGPYKEVLPCEDVCYELVRSCPASLEFACPLEGFGLNYSYGRKRGDDEVTCNWPGVPWMNVNGGGRLAIDFLRVLGVSFLVMVMGWMV